MLQSSKFNFLQAILYPIAFHQKKEKTVPCSTYNLGIKFRGTNLINLQSAFPFVGSLDLFVAFFPCLDGVKKMTVAANALSYRKDLHPSCILDLPSSQRFLL